ncbi:V-type ATP synthase subunit C [Clostridium sp. NSJ-6]|uniref:V-type ATP synthase subunit C n=1 Tax=Clostridium hominis TaxID=2763036 RepID=A0ABR7DF70_9CLOT|nr:V-type ATP synthase subunit C [Clostridium hominis]MBC5630021.1 V-type ATP synthase subunit C [Clostridium hominis]MDU2672265.1 V-type ATP synthase subunit C [Clostridium sp.]
MDVMQFTQALSRIWVFETRLLDRTKIERMIEAPSAEEALKILNETEYSNILSKAKRVNDYENILSYELKRVYELMYELCPVKDVVDLMSVKYRYHNLKVLLKGKFLSKDLSNLLIDLGIEDLKELKSIIDLDNFDDLKGYTKKAVIEVVKDFEENKDPQKIDIIVDRYMFDEMKDIKKKLDYKFTDKLVLATIDLTNIRTLIRLKKQGQGREFAAKVLISGGAIDKDTLISIINETPENIITKLSTTIYSDIIKEGIESFKESNSASLLEKLSDNYIMDLMKGARLVTFGPDRILSYIYAKETEIKIIRIIMVGKLNNISQEVIRERLRDSYV